jgi:hypothetical protein
MTLAKVPLFLNRIVPFKYLAHLSILLQKQTASVDTTTELPKKNRKKSAKTQQKTIKCLAALFFPAKKSIE